LLFVALKTGTKKFEGAKNERKEIMEREREDMGMKKSIKRRLKGETGRRRISKG
jgi:hypothetical protein